VFLFSKGMCLSGSYDFSCSVEHDLVLDKSDVRSSPSVSLHAACLGL
jgi:hypothetical protein